MAYVYVLYSESIDKYYTGSCLDIAIRLIQHNSAFFKNSYTSQASDWKIFFQINDLSKNQARSIGS